MKKENIERWITVNGNHIPIEKGQTEEEAINNFINDHYEIELENKKNKINPILINKVLNSPGMHAKNLNDSILKLGTLSGTKEQKELLSNMLMNRSVYDNDLESVLAYSIRNNKKLAEINIRKNGTSYYDSINNKLQIDPNQPEAFRYISHELGHSFDALGIIKCRSSTYISKKYNKTLSDMLKEEINTSFSEKDFKDINQYMNNKMTILLTAYRINPTQETANQYYYWSNEFQNQKVVLESSIKKYLYFKTKYPESYWDSKGINRGTELFAMITETKLFSSNGYFDKWLNKYASKSLEIYDEIIEDYIQNEVR